MKKLCAVLLLGLTLTSGSVASASSPFTGAVDAGNGWKWLSWFGYFADYNNGWVYHYEHQWLYCVGTSPASVWMWQNNMGWLWTSSTAYRWVWSNAAHNWIWYQGVTPSFTGPLIPGDQAQDGGGDIATYIGGMDVRFLANDGSKVESAGDWYFIDGDIVASAFEQTHHDDGSVTVTCRDFISGSSGLAYHFEGYTIHYSANPLVTDNPLTLAESELYNTLRGYWTTRGL